jgi:hypothetical protein
MNPLDIRQFLPYYLQNKKAVMRSSNLLALSRELVFGVNQQAAMVNSPRSLPRELKYRSKSFMVIGDALST